ncbi:MAG: hypothetical protein LBH18_07900 [Spirochaetaceae bacterium]|nr:hypothetical protein [Spirochaetaceae bacterium]
MMVVKTAFYSKQTQVAWALIPSIKWNNSSSGEAGNAIRAAAAKRIVDIVMAWDTEEE